MSRPEGPGAPPGDEPAASLETLAGALLSVSEASSRGFTRSILADSENGLHSHRLLVRPDADLDGSFLAFDVEELDYLIINGWLYTIEEDRP